MTRVKNTWHHDTYFQAHNYIKIFKARYYFFLSLFPSIHCLSSYCHLFSLQVEPYDQNSSHATDLYIGSCFDPVNLQRGPTFTSIGGTKMFAIDSRWSVLFTTTRRNTLWNFPFDKICMRSPTLTTNVFGTTSSVTHRVGRYHLCVSRLEARLLHYGSGQTGYEFRCTKVDILFESPIGVFLVSSSLSPSEQSISCINQRPSGFMAFLYSSITSLQAKCGESLMEIKLIYIYCH